MLGALQLVPFAPLVAAVAFFIGKRNYGGDLDRLDALRDASNTLHVDSHRSNGDVRSLTTRRRLVFQDMKLISSRLALLHAPVCASLAALRAATEQGSSNDAW